MDTVTNKQSKARKPRRWAIFTQVVFLRRVIQAGFVGFAVFVGARHLWAGSGPTGAASFDAYCPFGGIETLWQFITGGVFLRKLNSSNLVVLAATLATALVMGRAFCGWICPLGSVQEWLARLAQKLTGGRKGGRKNAPLRRKNAPLRKAASWLPIKLPPAVDRPLRYLKYVVLGWVLWSSISAVVPPLEPFCPYKALFHFELESALTWSVVIVMIVGSLLVERFWCRYLCPMGTVLSVFNKISPLRVHTDKAVCTDCGLCGSTCGMGIEDRPENIRSLECIRCLDCLDTCKRPEATELRLG